MAGSHALRRPPEVVDNVSGNKSSLNNPKERGRKMIDETTLDTKKPFNWRDYIHVEEAGFSKENLAKLYKDLDDLSETADFRRMLIESQRSEIYEAWRELVDYVDKYEDKTDWSAIDHYHFNKYCKDNQDFKLTIMSGENMHGGLYSSFHEGLRVVIVNYEKSKYWTHKSTSGEKYTVSDKHYLAHEIEHSTGLNEYRFGLAHRKAIAKIQTQDALGQTSVPKEKRMSRLSWEVRSFMQSVIEPRVMKSVNRILPKQFGEPVRGDYFGEPQLLPCAKNELSRITTDEEANVETPRIPENLVTTDELYRIYVDESDLKRKMAASVIGQNTQPVVTGNIIKSHSDVPQYNQNPYLYRFEKSEIPEKITWRTIDALRTEMNEKKSGTTKSELGFVEQELIRRLGDVEHPHLNANEVSTIRSR